MTKIPKTKTKAHPCPIVERCSQCKNEVKESDKAVQCDECNFWIHAKCNGLSDDEYSKLLKSDDDWCCKDCVSPCGMCKADVVRSHSAIECDKCKTWIHSSCASVNEELYSRISTPNCSWYCPRCNTNNTSLFTSQIHNIKSYNIYDHLSKTPQISDTGPNNKKSARISDSFNHKSIKFVSININGIRGKKLELQAYLASEEPEIVAIQETKIDKSIMTNELVPDSLDYDVYRKDRSGKGGGTMLLTKRHLKSAPVTKLDNDSESCWCTVTLHGKTHFFGSWYRPPGEPSERINLLQEQLTKIKSLGKKNQQPFVHIMGDFNYPKINWLNLKNKNSENCLCDSEGQLLIDIMHEIGAEQLVLFPTREKNTLDLLITTYPSFYSEVTSPDRLSDHDMVLGVMKCSAPRKSRPERMYLQYSKGDFVKMREETITFSKEKYFNGHQGTRTVAQNWEMIKAFLETTTESNIPRKKAKGKVSPPWITKKIKSRIKQKNKAHTMFKRYSNSTLLEKRWKDLRREVKKEIDASHDNHVNNLIGDIREDSKPFWRYVASQKSDTQGIPPLVVKDQGTTAYTDSEKAEALNSQFTSVFTKEQYDAIPYTPVKVTMPDISLTRKGVEKILKKLNVSKAMGPDNISPRILKELAFELSEVLAHFFQQSLSIGVIPNDWKTANICPLFKKTDRTIPSNYRPVSLTCILCKILEHIVCSNFMGHLESEKILNPKQHAFRKGHSCETQLVNVINDWAASIDKNQQLDRSKLVNK